MSVLHIKGAVPKLKNVVFFLPAKYGQVGYPWKDHENAVQAGWP